jgi:hypothetical protein
MGDTIYKTSDGSTFSSETAARQHLDNQAFDNRMIDEWADREARRKTKPGMELINNYNNAWKLYGEKKYGEAANDFATVVNSLRDPEWQKYINEMSDISPKAKEMFDQMNARYHNLCTLAGIGYNQHADKFEQQGSFLEAFKYRYTAIVYFSYSDSSDNQGLFESNIQALTTYFSDYGDVCMGNGKTDEANAYYQHAVNIANSESLMDLRKRGITLNASLDSVNNDAEARYKAKNYPLAEHLWQKAANEFGDSSAKQKIAKMQKEMEAEASSPAQQRQTSSAPSPAPQQQASSPKFCKQCGKALREGAKFCGGCGAKQ